MKYLGSVYFNHKGIFLVLDSNERNYKLITTTYLLLVN